jgi:alkaline phosphatase D
MLQKVNKYSILCINMILKTLDYQSRYLYYIIMVQKIYITLFFSLLTGIVWGQNLTHGPVVGGVTDKSAVFVLRTDTSAIVQVELSTATDFSDSILSSAFNTENDSDYFGKVRIEGLEAATLYFYRAVINTEPVIENTVRSFRSFPGIGSATTFSFQFGSGQQKGGDPNSNGGDIFPLMATEKPEFMIHQGDWGYPDTTDTEGGQSGNYFSLDYMNIAASYRSRYDSSFPMIDLLKVSPVLYTYDDHDLMDDNCDGTFPQQGIQNSIRGYLNMFPGYPLADSTKGIWHKVTYGNVDIFMVDNRSQRSPNIEAFVNSDIENPVFDPPPGHSILGSDQMNWLLDELNNSEATWKFISTGTPFNPALYLAIELTILSKSIIDSVEVPGLGFVKPADVLVELVDKWAGFPEDIFKIIDHVRLNNIENVIFISGDSHTAALDDGKNSILPELMDSGLDRTNGRQIPLFEQFGVKIWNRGGHTPDLAPEEFGNSYGRITVFGEDSVRLEAVSETGTILGQHTVKDGFLPREIGSAVAPIEVPLDFGEVSVGELGILGFLIVSTSVGDLEISNISLTGDSEFILDPFLGDLPLTINSGDKKLVGLAYLPSEEGKTSETTIVISTNDPENPSYTISAVGTAISATSIGDENQISHTYQLYQNYPNPFNPRTIINYELPTTNYVELGIYNLLGQKMITLVSEKQRAGKYSVEWDASGMASGIYYYMIKAGEFQDVKKMILIR